jgi:hypothetical protein
MFETAMLASFLIASAGQNQSALIAVASALTGIIFTKAVDWLFEKGRRSYEQKQTAAAIMAELEAIVQIVRLRQYQNILAQNIESMMKDGIVKNPKIPIRENFMPVYTANLAKIGLLRHPVPSNLATLYTFALGIKEDFRTLYDLPDGVDVQIFITIERNILLLLNYTMALAEETIADLRVFLHQRLGAHLRQKHDEAQKRRKAFEKQLEEQEKQIRRT